jgi:hypothetical protein
LAHDVLFNTELMASGGLLASMSTFLFVSSTLREHPYSLCPKSRYPGKKLIGLTLIRCSFQSQQMNCCYEDRFIAGTIFYLEGEIIIIEYSRWISLEIWQSNYLIWWQGKPRSAKKAQSKLGTVLTQGSSQGSWTPLHWSQWPFLFIPSHCFYWMH